MGEFEPQAELLADTQVAVLHHHQLLVGRERREHTGAVAGTQGVLRDDLARETPAERGLDGATSGLGRAHEHERDDRQSESLELPGETGRRQTIRDIVDLHQIFSTSYGSTERLRRSTAFICIIFVVKCQYNAMYHWPWQPWRSLSKYPP